VTLRQQTKTNQQTTTTQTLRTTNVFDRQSTGDACMLMILRRRSLLIFYFTPPTNTTPHYFYRRYDYYLRQSGRSEHWRRLRDWSVSRSGCVHDDSSSSPHVIHNRQERWRPPVKTSTFYSSSVLITSLGGDMHSHERFLVIRVMVIIVGKSNFSSYG